MPLPPKIQGSSQMNGQEDCKSEVEENCFEGQSFVVIRDIAHMNSQWL